MICHNQCQVLFLLTVWSFSIICRKGHYQSDFSIDHLVMSMCRVISYVVGRSVRYHQGILLTKLVSLNPAPFRTPRPNLPVTPGIF